MLQAPKDLSENKRFRLKILASAERSPEFQALCIRKCQSGIAGFVFFCDAFLWTFDPREKDPHKPFILWPKQQQFVEWLYPLYLRSQMGEKINIGVDKPRAVGFTNLIMAFILWQYLFSSFTARIGSWKEEYVDKAGEPDALFTKIDYMLSRLPSWLVSAQARAHLIIRPRTDEISEQGNSIVGESANPQFGRGGRKNLMFFDEFGFWEWARSSWEAAGESTNLRIAASTPPPAGKDSHHYKLLTGQAGRVNRYDFDWRDVPTRDDKWLAEARATKSEEEFAREVLKSFEGTTKGKVYAISVRHATLSKVGYEPSLPIFLSWDFGLDSVAMIWWQKDFKLNRVYMIDCYSNSNKSIDFYVPFVTGITTSGIHSYQPFELDVIKRHLLWRKDITHFGDPDVRKRNLINKESTLDYLSREHGIYVQSIPWGGRTWEDMREKTLRLFPRLEINEELCEPVLSALRNAKFPERSEGSQAQNEPAKPIHDWTCLAGETMIRTLNGWHQIKDLVGKDFYVWSYSSQEKRLVPTKASKCWQSGTNAPLIIIKLDNGRSVKCTKEHRFMLRSGEYREARFLKAGDSLMPFYERINRGYLDVYLNDGSLATEHRYIFHRFNGIQEGGFHVDHIDNNKHNNNPKNLQLLSIAEHCKKTDSAHFDVKKRSLKRVMTITKKQLIKICGWCKKSGLMSYKQLYCSKKCSGKVSSFKKRIDNARNFKDVVCVWCGTSFKGVARMKTCSSECAEKRTTEYNIQYNRALRKGERIKMADVQNHKVIGIELATEKENVYDIEVPEFHNFVAEGVVVHNSHYRTSVEYFADNEPESGIVTTRVQSTSPTEARAKAPHEIEREKIQQEKDQLAGIARRIQTVVHNTQRGTFDPNRII